MVHAAREAVHILNYPHDSTSRSDRWTVADMLRLKDFGTLYPIPDGWRVSGTVPQLSLAIKLPDGQYRGYVQLPSPVWHIEYVEFDVDGTLLSSTYVANSNGHFAMCEDGTSTPPVLFDHDGDVFYWKPGMSSPSQLLGVPSEPLGLAIACDREGMPVAYVQHAGGLSMVNVVFSSSGYETGPEGDSIQELSAQGAYLIAAFANNRTGPEYKRTFHTLMFLRPKDDVWEWCGVNVSAYPRTVDTEEEANVSVSMVSMEDTTPVRPPDKDLYVGDSAYPADYPMNWSDGTLSLAGYRHVVSGTADSIECWLPDVMYGTGYAISGTYSFPKPVCAPVANEFIFDMNINGATPGGYADINYGAHTVRLMHELTYPGGVPTHKLGVYIDGTRLGDVLCGFHVGVSRAIKVRIELTSVSGGNRTITASVYTASATGTPFGVTVSKSCAGTSDELPLSITQSSLVAFSLFVVGTDITAGWGWTDSVDLQLEGYEIGTTACVSDGVLSADIVNTVLNMSIGFPYASHVRQTFQRAYYSEYLHEVQYYSTKGSGAEYISMELIGGGREPLADQLISESASVGVETIMTFKGPAFSDDTIDVGSEIGTIMINDRYERSGADSMSVSSEVRTIYTPDIEKPEANDSMSVSSEVGGIIWS